MKLYNKEELKEIFGKESFWLPSRLINKLIYVSGIDVFDELLDGKLFTEVAALINLRERPHGLQIEMMKNFKYYRTAIDSSRIKSIDLEEKSKVIEEKEKSVIGRAVIGGLIFGPVGALVGGMSGIGTKKIVKGIPDHFLSINYLDENNNEHVILFACKDKDKKDTDFFFRHSKYRKRYNRFQ